IRDFHVTGVQTCALPIWTLRLPVLNYSGGITCTAGPIIPLPRGPITWPMDGKSPIVILIRRNCATSYSSSSGNFHCLVSGDQGQIGRASCRERGESATVE